MNPGLRLATRWRRPGMQRVLFLVLYDGDAGIVGGGERPGASAPSR